MRKIITLIAGVLCLQAPAYSQLTDSRNYIISRTYKQSGAPSNNVSQVDIQVSYLDGIGRPLQNVLISRNPDGMDIIQPFRHDAAGRQALQYLPYAASGSGAYRDNALTAVETWYSNNTAGLQKIGATDLNRPFLESGFEPSPLSRVSSQRAPGERSGVSTLTYRTNTSTEVKRYDYAPASNSINENGTYRQGALDVARMLDEQGNISYEYTDMNGQLVLRKVLISDTETEANTLSTYYVYDDRNLLRAVLQPNYQDSSPLENSAFLYDYDDRNRIIRKQIPDAGTTEFVYDQFNRLAMSRDANQVVRKVWGFIKYDALNRPIATGEISSEEPRQFWATNVNVDTEHHENRNNTVVAGYSLSNTAPKAATEADLLTITFYDDYLFSKASNLGYVAPSGYPSYHTAVKGVQTGGRTKMIPGNEDDGIWLTNVNYFDPEYRIIQTIRELNELGTSPIERVSTKYKYDLAAVIEEQKTEQILSSTVTQTHTFNYLYDHADRMLSVRETVTNGTSTKQAITLAQRYNPLGQLKSTWYHAYTHTPSKFRARTDHTFNIRGWITDGKTVYKRVFESDPDANFYSFALSYANPSDAAKYSNGNISAMQWHNRDESNYTKGLNFSYDGANRLSESSGQTHNSALYPDIESDITYDKNGNLLTLTRGGTISDILTYSYTTGTIPGNRLKTISDASGNNTGVRTGTLGDYEYDANGNMTKDANRQAAIKYNHLNLPMTVTMDNKTFTYDYDATGVKHKYVTDTLTVKYAGSMQYNQSNALTRVTTASGQIVPHGDTLRLDYYLKDHLGNVRVVFNESGEIMQTSDYYPFGLAINRDETTQAAQNKINRYLYNEKELQPGSGFIDYGARMYMPEIGRFGTNDRFAEKYGDLTSYQYGGNNPLKYIDVNGDSLWISFKGSNILYNNGKLYNNDGSEYSGKVRGFLKQSLNALNSINDDPDGKSALNILSNSKNNIFVKHASENPKSPGANQYDEFNRNASYAVAMKDANQGRPEDGGSGGNVYWNPGEGTVGELGGGYGTRPKTNLAHELYHAYDGNLGLLDNRESESGLGIGEARASYFENLLRKSMGYPYREFYNTKAKGPIRLLDSNNKPIFVPAPKIKQNTNPK